jgi:hypothetical protein
MWRRAPDQPEGMDGLYGKISTSTVVYSIIRQRNAKIIAYLLPNIDWFFGYFTLKSLRGHPCLITV